MTRINLGIKPKHLSDKHLLAEHREIKRIPNTISSGKANLNNIPEKFTLGKGHVKFFYNKLQTLFLRYCDIYEECENRGFNITSYHSCWDKDKIPKELFGNYQHTEEDVKLIINRLLEKDYESYKHLLPIKQWQNQKVKSMQNNLVSNSTSDLQSRRKN